MRLLLIRHGLSVTNKSRCYTGQRDVALAEKGYKEAECTARYVLENYRVDAIYSSDLKRAVHTVKPIADALQLPIHTTEKLREIDVGLWGGLSFETVKEKYAESQRLFSENPDVYPPDGGETYMQVQARALEKLTEIAQAHPGQTVVVGTHGGVLRTFFRAWLNLPDVYALPLAKNASVPVVDYEEGVFTVVERAIDKHLDTLTDDSTLV